MNTRSIFAPSNSAIFWNGLLIVISLSKGFFSNQICCGTAICNRYSIAEIHGNPACEIRHVVPCCHILSKPRSLEREHGPLPTCRSEMAVAENAWKIHAPQVPKYVTVVNVMTSVVLVESRKNAPAQESQQTAANQHRKQSSKVEKHPQAKEGCLVLPLNSALFPCHVTLAERAPICLGWPSGPYCYTTILHITYALRKITRTHFQIVQMILFQSIQIGMKSYEFQDARKNPSSRPNALQPPDCSWVLSNDFTASEHISFCDLRVWY